MVLNEHNTKEQLMQPSSQSSLQITITKPFITHHALPKQKWRPEVQSQTEHTHMHIVLQ